MKSFTHLVCSKQIKILTALTLLLSVSSIAQRNYTIAYSDNIKGSAAMFGNTLMAIYKSDNTTVDTAKMNATRSNGGSNSGNDNSNMLVIDVDGNSGAGSATTNSSSADLSLPAGTNNIKFARLYWGGRVTQNTADITDTANQKIKIKYATNAGYYQYKADHMDYVAGSGSNPLYTYQAYVDITALVQTNGSGTYTVGNIPLSQGDNVSGGAYGGWCVVVAYENTTAYTYYNSVRVYDGFMQVFNGGSPTSTSVTLSGLNVPSGSLSLTDAKMGVLSWEGDANLTGDSLRVNQHYISNTFNPSNNIFNGSITDNGAFVHTKNPDYFNQMALDIDQFYVGTGFDIHPNDQSVTLAFRTESDQYYPGMFTFVIKTKDPNPYLDKTVSDSNNNHIAQAGEALTYTLKGKNTGVGNANLTVITDTLPSTVTYIPGTLQMNFSPGLSAGALTDASGDDQAEYIVSGSYKIVRFRVGSGATKSVGGTLADNDSFNVQFKVRVNIPSGGASVPPIVNVARVVAYSDANVQSIDDGTAIIDPQGGPLPVSLTNFMVSLSGDKTIIDWTTSLENNCKQYFVQRSEDGKTFGTVATIAGNGTTAIQHTYTATDDVADAKDAVVYYRLAQVDADGKVNYSRIIAVKLNNVSSGFAVSPNPFTSYVNISLSTTKSEIATAKVLDVTGRVLSSRNIQLSKGTNYISIDELSSLPRGNYAIQLISSQGSMIKKVTKQ
ncbi:T9SS type A sorting domain-containing protein [Ferruginibacter albus]|uniref:T9SS type A sorting domain-containing protein n=1 Tax=Ferruginibacter albus TaxID=2875540 RepID=UPI001CC3DF8D|nr:T9SS type A sorting domain-containing protein [Ferruginibacter albus]UAY52821.1 T9SS type A sorting domain-containing protein [Ferruginibacter albus]